MLSHTVFFTLTDSSDTACQNLIDAANKYLKPHDGIAYFGVGKLATEYDRPVNDRDFHIALNVVFETKEAHDVYQVSEMHLEFIAQQKSNWASVRVFDAHVN